MKRTLIFGLMLAAAMVVLPATETKAATTAVSNEVAQDWRYQRRNRGRNRSYNRYRNRTRSYITTRTVRRGFRWYRETIRVTRYSNGRVRTRVIRRVRIR